MTEPKALALDANILLRSIFGVRVRELLKVYADTTVFYAPDVCFTEARRNIESVSLKRGADPQLGFRLLDEVSRIVHPVDRSEYIRHEAFARNCIRSRDITDWPVVATALLLQCPVWTEDRDFFGSGIATWTTANVGLYLATDPVR